MFKFLMTYYVSIKKVKGVWYGKATQSGEYQTVPDFLLSAGEEYCIARKKLEERLKE